ncbi:hypothetical protein HY571_00055 [Candidatus Micrarchaeota archaeon]|nr:hypothetical protein [Candidatus Micrarchaeota archaeon]
MPHACVKCRVLYPDQSEAILKGCACGSRIFYFMRPETPIAQLTIKQESDALELSQEIIELSREKPVVIEADGPENIRVIEPGSYELDVAALFKGNPVIIRTDSDVYYVKLPAPSKRKAQNR